MLVASWGAAGASFLHGPYTGGPSETSVTVSWSTDEPLAGRIEFAVLESFETSGVLPHSVLFTSSAGSPACVYHVSLIDLRPDTDYVYQLVLLEKGAVVRSPIGRFRTAPPSEATVSFAVLADTQRQGEGPSKPEWLGNAIASGDHVDFVLHAGDLVDSPETLLWDDWFRSFGEMLLAAPFLPVLGNHEVNHPSYYENFVFPPGGGTSNERWWALHWGDVVVVGLDSNLRRLSDLVAQQEWAIEHLGGPEAHKFVLLHHPVFSSNPYQAEGHNFDVTLHPLFVEYGVDIVLSGHVHGYERIERDGVTYLVVGGGGAMPHPFDAHRIAGSVVALDGFCFYARIEASPDGIAVEILAVGEEKDGEARSTEDEILDRFALPGETLEP